MIYQPKDQRPNPTRTTLADLIEADRRIPQGGEILPVQGRFLPAAPLEIEIDDVTVLIALAKEILVSKTLPFAPHTRFHNPPIQFFFMPITWKRSND